MPDLPNPIGALAGGFTDGLSAAAETAFDAAMQSLWTFAVNLLHGVFDILDELTTPNLDPRTGPLAAVLPATAWVGGVLLVVLCLVQVGKAAMSAGTGMWHLFKGLGQYLIVAAVALGVFGGFIAAANAAALGILSAGLGVDSWAGVSTANSAWQNTVNGVSGVGLGLIALFGVIPAVFSLLVIAIVREAAILVIAATIPILAAGLVAEATARWFWVALRWLMALVMLTPAVALVMSIGLRLAAGATGATGATGGTQPVDPAVQAAATDPGRSIVTALVAAAVLLVAVFCPLALFKLFAFVDPATPSGQRLRTSLADHPGGAPAAAVPTSTGAASTAGRTSQEADTEQQVDTRWSQALSKLSPAHQVFGSTAQTIMSAAAPVLAAAGVGQGLDHDPTPSTHRRTDSSSRQDRSSQPSSAADGGASSPPDPDPPVLPDPPTPPPPPTSDIRPDDSVDHPAGGSTGGSNPGAPRTTGAGKAPSTPAAGGTAAGSGGAAAAAAL
ncbi:MAG TPA: hypothetical protein VID93_02700 [Acidimicrobiales bacterium]